MTSVLTLALNRDEEVIAQLLTRDAWSYFNTFSPAKEDKCESEIPSMPRHGRFVITSDREILTYYLNFAGTYFDELSLVGWSPRQFSDACDSFLTKLEAASGLPRRAPSPLHADHASS